MSRTIVLIMLLSWGILLNGQEKSANDYKKEAAEAYQVKDFQKGLEAFENAIRITESEGNLDTTLYYNAGICAYKTEDFSKASAYFARSVELGYKTCNALLFRANSLKKTEQYEEMESVCNEGISSCSNNKEKFNDILFGYYMKAGLDIFNNGARIQSAATGFQQSDAAKYDSEMERAKKEFSASLPYLQKAQNIDPSDANVLKALKSAYEILGMTDKAGSR
ncbi:MAG: hypothetical protein JW861_04575 [Bacteroidales bacterium]|nr:hypothetical protein [Bacteroidales bacterium]